MSYYRGQIMSKIVELCPQYIEKIWGGDFFSNILKVKDKKIGECILFSADLKIIDCMWENDGKKLREIIENEKEVLGWNLYEKILSLEIKIIDAKENLSIQVHPEEKDEMWYVLQNEKNTCIYLGWQEELDSETIKEKIYEADILKELRSYLIEKEDCIYIPGGVIHSLGKGIRVLEVKERGETYRLYDFGRNRTLELEKGIREISVRKKGMIQKKKENGLIGTIGIWEIHRICFFNAIKIPIYQKVCIAIFIEGQGVVKCLGKIKEYYAGKLYLMFVKNEKVSIEGSGTVIMLLNKGRM